MTGVAAKVPSVRLASTLAGLVGVAVVSLVALTDPRAALQGWLAAAFAFTALPLGARSRAVRRGRRPPAPLAGRRRTG